MINKRRQYQALLSIAREAKQNAYVPYSKFHVGVAVLCSNGKIFTGCNIENSSYGLTLCAERVAIFKAVSEGIHSFKAIAIVSDNPNFTPPCGACRQVLLDLAGDIDFIMGNKKGEMKIIKLSSLLPHAFTHNDLARKK